MSDSVNTKNVGKISQIIGPVLDVAFGQGQVPNIYNALTIQAKNAAGTEISVTCEVQQLLGDQLCTCCSYECYRWFNAWYGSLLIQENH